MKKLLSIALVAALLLTSVAAMADELTGKAKGFGGELTVTVTTQDGTITGVTVDSHGETNGIGTRAIDELPAKIVETNSADVDAVAGATVTSNAIIAAVKNAIDPVANSYVVEEKKEAEVVAVTASGLSHGIGIVGTPRLGPGADAENVGVYSFNEVIAYVIVDSDHRIVDMEVDIVEAITPNHDESNEDDNFMAGWPGQSYNSDADGDGVVDGQLEETEEIFTAETLTWLTKRQKGDAYRMNSGTWEEEMDIFENFFKGKTVEEINEWNAKYCSDVNGRPITPASTREEDVAKFSVLTDEEKAVVDAISGATMSLTDPHGDILAAINKAVANVVPMRAEKSIAKIGMGVNVMPRLGPGSDDQGMPCYSLNTSVAAVCYDADGKVVDMLADVLEIITPNHDGADDNSFTGWPGQSYNADVDADGVVDEVWTQTEESFVEQIAAFRTKRDLGDAYRMNAGTWTEEMTAYEGAMVGKTTEEISAWFAACFSDANGRSLHGTSEREEDVAKYAAMTDEQKTEMDAISGATMALRDAHGDILSAIEQADAVAKPVDITIE